MPIRIPIPFTRCTRTEREYRGTTLMRIDTVEYRRYLVIGKGVNKYMRIQPKEGSAAKKNGCVPVDAFGEMNGYYLVHQGANPSCGINIVNTYSMDQWEPAPKQHDYIKVELSKS